MTTRTTIRPPNARKADRPPRLGRTSSAILKILANLFVARTPDLCRLISKPNPDTKYEDHLRNINRALKFLRDYPGDHIPHENGRSWGYIRSVPWTDPTKDNHRFDYNCGAHGLTDRGVRLVQKEALDPDGNARSFQAFSINHVDHELRINDFLELLEAALKKIGLELIVYDNGLLVTYKSHVISPDRLLYIYDPATNTRSAPIFLEYEKQKRGKYEDGRPQVIRKLINLRDYYDTDQCEKAFGFRTFYVLTILRTERKRVFLFEDLIENKCAKGTFLLTSEPLYQADVLGPILKTWKDTKEIQRSILDL